MSSFFHQPLSEGEWWAIIVLTAIVGGTILSIVKVSTRHLRRMQLDDIEAGLKSEMIAEGMSADDIVKVLNARGSCEGSEAMAKIAAAISTEGRHPCRSRRAMHRAMQEARAADQATA